MLPALLCEARVYLGLKPQLSEPPRHAEPHSKAFETFVRDTEDLVGLLAYAFYKESIRERVRAGQDVPESS